MSVRPLFRVLLHLLLLTGFSALLATGRVDVYSGGLFTLTVLASLLAGNRLAGRWRSPGGWRAVGLTVALLLLFLADLTLISGEVVLAVVHLTMIVALLRLFSLKSPRDHLYIFLISFGFLLVATTLTIEIDFALFSVLYFLLAAMALALWEIRRASIRYGALADAGGGSSPDPLDGVAPRPLAVPVVPLLIASSLALMVTAALAIPLFTVLPRLTLGILQFDLSRRQMISGFSEQTSLRDVTAIRSSSEVAFYVRPGEPPETLPPDLKWRGIALDQFDGRNWTMGHEGTRLLMQRAGDLVNLEPRRVPEHLFLQEFFLEAQDSRVLFLAARPLSVSRNVGPVYLTRTSTVMAGQPHDRKIRYVGYSDIRRPTFAELDASPPVDPAQVPAVLLELPYRSDRLRGLVDQLTADQPTPWRRALAMQDYLRRTCAYGEEDLPLPDWADPVEHFLFRTRRGHCEYFATALAVMLRYAGIPSRLVNGYQLGQLNPFNATFTVRQSNAHSWVEAFLPGVGWVEMDPTPMTLAPPESPFVSWFRQMTDTISFFWISNVINFDQGEQVRLARRVRDMGQMWRAWVRSVQERLRQLLRQVVLSLIRGLAAWPVWGGAAIGVAVGLVLAVWLARRLFGHRFRWPFHWPFHWVGRAGPGGRHPAALVYGRFLRRVERPGRIRRPGETPAEFAARLAGLLSAERLATFTDAYYRARYADGGVEALAALERAYDNLTWPPRKRGRRVGGRVEPV